MEKRDYGALIDRAWEGALREFGCPLSDEAVRELARRLTALPPAQRRLAFGGRHLTNALKVVKQLAREAFELRQSSVPRAMAAADTAVELSAMLCSRTSQFRQIADGRSEAWMQKANLLRLSDDLVGADRAWRRVGRLLACGTGDLKLQADADQLQASLRKDQGNYSNAALLLEKAVALYDDLGEGLAAARTRLSLGIIELRSGEPARAAKTTLAAAATLEPTNDPYLGLVVHHNLILCFAEAGAFESARRIFRRTRPLYELFEMPVLAARAVWVLGRIAANQGRWAAALEAFQYSRQVLTRRFLPFDASLAALEEALAQLHLGDTAAVRELALAMHPIFVAKGVPTEASAALLLFVEAARLEAATVVQLETLIGDLKDRLAPPTQRGAHGRFMA